MNPDTFENMRKFLPFLESQNLCVVSKDWNAMVQNSTSKINCEVWIGEFAEMPLEKAKKICPLITNMYFHAECLRPTRSKQGEIYPHFTNLKHLNFVRHPNNENFPALMMSGLDFPHTDTFCSEMCSIIFENSQNTLESLTIDGHCFDQYLPQLFLGKVFLKLQSFYWEIWPDTDKNDYGEVLELNMMQNFFNQFSKMFPNLNPGEGYFDGEGYFGEWSISNLLCGYAETEAFGKWARDAHGVPHICYSGEC
jgi:hypothetical protein